MCGLVANLLIADPSLTYNDIKYMLRESRNDDRAHIQVSGYDCNSYYCTFPLYNCSKSPQDYSGFDYIPETSYPIYEAEIDTNNDYVGDYDGFTDYSCNTVGIAIIDAESSDNSVMEVVYEPTDICATMKTNDDIVISWAYVCVDEDIAAFVTWDGDECDSDEYEYNVVKY